MDERWKQIIREFKLKRVSLPLNRYLIKRDSKVSISKAIRQQSLGSVYTPILLPSWDTSKLQCYTSRDLVVPLSIRLDFSL